MRPLYHFRNSIRVSLTIAFISVLAIFADGQQQRDDIQKLSLNHPLTRQVKGGETHTFQLNVKAGFYARVEVEQKNIDVVVSLFAPDGKLVVEMDGKDGRLWREAVSCISETGGVYRVEIKAYGAADKVGIYTVKLEENRQTVSDDCKRTEAEAHFSAGTKFYSQDSKITEAAQEFKMAAELWHETDDVKWEAEALVSFGNAANDLYESEQAINIFSQAVNDFRRINDRNGVLTAIIGLGNSYSNIYQFDKARSYLYHLPLNIYH